MKILLISAGLIFSMSALAQTTSNPALQSLMNKFNQRNPGNFKVTAPSAGLKIAVPIEKQPAYSHTLPSGVIVYSLPQDNMPCIVPPTSGVMPIAGVNVKAGQPGAIPNAGYAPMNLKSADK